MALKYTTTQKLGEAINIIKDIPSWAVGSSPANEVVGTGDNIVTQFFLDQKNIVAGSYIIYANAVAMTETTHYTLNKDNGEITLTSAGKTLLSTNSLTAKYKYFENGMSDSYLTSVLERAESKVDNETNTSFTDGTATNPTYPSNTEIQSSTGYFRNQIIIDKKPMIDISTTLNGAVDISQNTIDLASGTGSTFPSSGSLIIDSEVISYTGITTDQLTGVTRGTLGTTAATHDDGASVHSTILFISNTQEGTARTYTVQSWNTMMYASEDGLVYSFDQSVFNQSQFPDRLTRQDVADRIKIIYYYGYDTIPNDITRLALIFAKEMLLKDNIGSSLIKGRDDFQPGVMDTDSKESESIINSYIVIPMGNT